MTKRRNVATAHTRQTEKTLKQKRVFQIEFITTHVFHLYTPLGCQAPFPDPFERHVRAPAAIGACGLCHISRGALVVFIGLSP